MLAAVRAGNRVCLDIVKHLFLCHSVCMSFGVKIVDKVICTKTHLAFLAVKKRVGERCNVSACFPYSRVHEDVGVNFKTVPDFLYKAFSPGILYVVFKSCTQRAVVPCVCKSAVNVTACKNKTSALT